MNRLGHIVIHGTDSVRTERMRERLVEGNCSAVISGTAAEMWKEIRDSRPDLAIIDVESPGCPGMEIAAECRQRKPAITPPVLLWAAHEFAGLYDAALAVQADDVFAGSADTIGPVELIARLRPLMRLSTQRAEVRRRTALARDCGVDIPADPDLSVGDGPYRVLAIGDSPKLGQRVSAALATRLKGVDFQGEPFAARDRLFDGDFDAAVMEVGGAIAVDAAMEFCREIRNHPRLYNLPLLVIAESGLELPHDVGLRAGASLVLEGGAGDERLRYYLASYGRRQQVRRRIRDAIEATKTVKTRGTHTHSYTREFLRDHLAVLIGEACAWQRHLTVLVFSVAGSAAELRAECGDEAARELVRQIAQWISGLVRLEDLVANIGGGEFCVTLPDTPLGEANAVIDRVTGILNYTDYAVKDVYRPVKVTAEVGYAEFEAEDDGDAVIERARGRLG